MDNNDVMLRIKLQELQNQKQGDQRQANLITKREVSQDDIDEYNAQFDDKISYIEPPEEEELKEEVELEPDDIEETKTAIQFLEVSRKRLNQSIDKIKSKYDLMIDDISNDDSLKENKKRSQIKRAKEMKKNELEYIVQKDKVLSDQLEAFNKELLDQDNIRQENVNRRIEWKKKNENNLKKYMEDLNLENQGKLKALDQGPNESYDEFIQRVQETIDNRNKSTIRKDLDELNNVKKLKEKLSSIIKSKTVIENVLKKLDPKDVNELLKKWTKFKTVYQKEYSFESKVSEQEVLSIYDSYEDPITVNLLKEEKEEVVTSLKFIDRKDNTALVQTLNGNLYLKLGKDLVLYSKTGDTGSFRSINFQQPGAKHYVETVLGDKQSKKDITMFLVESGVKRQKAHIEPDYQEANFNTVYGMGLTKPIVENFILGKILIKLDKLYSKNTLVILRNSNIYSKIPGFPNASVSDDFVKLILAIYNEEDINPYFSKLKQVEKDLYIQLLYIAGLQNSNVRGDGISSDTLVDQLKERLNLIEAEIEAGNNGREIRLELKNLLDKLVNLRAIPFAKAKKHYNQILFQFFEQD